MQGGGLTTFLLFAVVLLLPTGKFAEATCRFCMLFIIEVDHNRPNWSNACQTDVVRIPITMVICLW